MQYSVGRGVGKPMVPDRALLILSQIVLQVHTIVCHAEVWCTAAATAIKLSSSDRRTSFRDHQIRLTNWLFCPKSESFTTTWFIFLHYMCFWCFFHLFCIHISRVDFPAGTYAKVYSSINMCSYSRSLSFSVVENREERHQNSEIVNFKVLSSLGCPSYNLSETVYQTPILLGHRLKITMIKS